MASRIPKNHYPLEKDERVQWFSAPHEDTVLVKTKTPDIFIKACATWHIVLYPILTEGQWTWFRINQMKNWSWVMFRWELDRLLIAICNGNPAKEAI